MADDADRLNEVSTRFREAGFDLRLYESGPGAWEAIWHPHERLSGLTSSAGGAGGTTTGATVMQAAEAALATLEEASGTGPPAT